MEPQKKKIICLTPVKNEAWILDLFLKATSLWADQIIIADQMSDDTSRQIASKYPKVKLVINKNESFGEDQRQKLLLNEARKIKGENILIALDADEILTPNFTTSDEWKKIRSLKPGTVIYFPFINVLPDKRKYWDGPHLMSWGYIDDGAPHDGTDIHSHRLPLPKNSEEYVFKEIIAMHYQFADWKRMESKHRWYQCWEKINYPKKSSIQIYRMYHHMDSSKGKDYKSMPEEWFKQYDKLGIKLGYVVEKEYRWDREMLDFIQKYGAQYFRRIDIWSIDWKELARRKGIDQLDQYSDPRNYFDKLLLKYLKSTQKHYPNFIILVIDKILRYCIR